MTDYRKIYPFLFEDSTIAKYGLPFIQKTKELGSDVKLIQVAKSTQTKKAIYITFENQPLFEEIVAALSQKKHLDTIDSLKQKHIQYKLSQQGVSSTTLKLLTPQTLEDYQTKTVPLFIQSILEKEAIFDIVFESATESKPGCLITFKQGKLIANDCIGLNQFLILSSTGNLKDVLNKKFEAIELKRKELVAHWEVSRPQWVEEAYLQEWGYRQVNKKQTEAALSVHPVKDHLLYSSLKKKSINWGIPFKKIKAKVTPIVYCTEELAQSLWANENTAQWLWSNKDDLFKAVATTCFEKLVEDLTASQSGDFLESIGINQDAWLEIVEQAISTVCYVKFDPSNQTPAITKELKKLTQEYSHKYAAQRCKEELPSHLKDYYPLARELDRQIIVVTGPTNSGKTYEALQALQRAESGVYLGPLRLLALEVRDKLADNQIPVSLVTGELVQIDPGAKHISSTIEMLSYSKVVDVAVIDEVQMIGDTQRGSAWLHAILGAPAKTVYLLGSPEALPVIKDLLKTTKEKVTYVQKQRLNELSVYTRPATGIMSRDVSKQSAIIAFSRKNVLTIAQELRRNGKKVSVIYGSLPPEVRRQQSELFANGQTDILVATDAVGLGLNLPISKVYFSTATKWNGSEQQPIDPHLVWQIAGRAGRYGHFEKGWVGAFDIETLNYVQTCLKTRPEELDKAYFSNLTFPIAEKIAQHLNTSKLQHILLFYKNYLKLEASISPAITEEQLVLAGIVDKYSTLDLVEKIVLCNAPAVYKELDAYYPKYVECIAKNQEFDTKSFLDKVTSVTYLDEMENAIKSLTLYCWMHYRFEHIFLNLKQVQEAIGVLNRSIQEKLTKAKRII